MNKPIKPVKPKQISPEQKTRAHYINFDDLFSKTTYYRCTSTTSEEITEEEYYKAHENSLPENDDYFYDSECENIFPSIQDIINKIPTGIPLDKVQIRLSSFDLIYETPIDHSKEVENFRQEMLKYDDLMRKYHTDLEFWKESKIKNKEKLLENRARLLENQLKQIKSLFR